MLLNITFKESAKQRVHEKILPVPKQRLHRNASLLK